MRPTLRHNRLIALIAAVAMVVVLCGYASHEVMARPSHSCHCDWSAHFAGVAGSAPHPVAVAAPSLALWAVPLPASATPRSARRPRAHLARAPPSAPARSIV
ncbi:MAG: hypothetical protein ACREUG_01595 [Steroidobacteraceae bacterium]